MRDGGKGDTQRPLGVDIDQFDNNWDAIFKKDKQQLEDAVNRTAKELMKEVKELVEQAPYQPGYEDAVEPSMVKALEPIPFVGMVDTDEV